MSTPLNAILIGAGQRGARAYASYALNCPEEVRFTAVAEPHAVRRQRFADDHDLDDGLVFEQWQDLIDRRPPADVAIVTTQDNMHVEPAIAAMEAGYDVLLEKPMADSLEGCVRLVQAAERTGRLLQICHVLRYSPYWQKVNEIVTSGRLGEIVTVEHRENVSFWHMAHSFVRGNWRNAGLSTPMILAKCCHDLDILVWNLQQPVRRLSAVGSLMHYRSESVGPEIPMRCTDGCPIEPECPFSAPGIYLDYRPWRQLNERLGIPFVMETDYPNSWPFSVLTEDPTLENRKLALETGPYGRCVYHCDNDVVDHHMVSMELENGASVSLVMHGHSYEEGRTMRYDGSKATLRARFLHGSGAQIIIDDHATGREEFVDVDQMGAGGHGGGDWGLFAGFLAAVRGEAQPLTDARTSLESHLLAFAAEEARLNRSVIQMADYRQQAETIAMRDA